VVGPHCVIEGRTEIGPNNEFFSGSQIGVLSQDRKHRRDLVGRLVIGDGNQFREHVTISASTLTTYDDDHRVTSIGDNCLFMAYAHVGHDCHVGSNVILANCTALSGHVEVDDHVIFGGLSGVHQFSSVGRYAFVGGMTAVERDVPPFMIVKGNPGRCRGPNFVGLRRHGYAPEARQRIKEMYRLLYRSGLNVSQAVQEIEARIADAPERALLLDFLQRSIRGVVAGGAVAGDD
jgi:UDP-N-acetylglucosamine acyltransferase